MPELGSGFVPGGDVVVERRGSPLAVEDVARVEERVVRSALPSAASSALSPRARPRHDRGVLDGLVLELLGPDVSGADIGVIAEVVAAVETLLGAEVVEVLVEAVCREGLLDRGPVGEADASSRRASGLGGSGSRERAAGLLASRSR